MDLINQLLGNFGLDMSLLLTLAGAVLLIVNAIKDKIPAVTGYWTQVVTVVVAFGLSLMVYAQDPQGINWMAVIITTFICWLGPDSLNSYINRKVTKKNG